MATNGLYSCRGLISNYIDKLGLWIFVWCHDDGYWPRDKRICYFLTDDASTFNPYAGFFILDRGASSDGTEVSYIYGVPESISSSGGKVTILYQDLSPFYGQQVVLTSGQLDVGTGQQPQKGNILEATFTGIGDIGQQIVWDRREFSTATSSYAGVLEVSDASLVDPTIPATGYSVPTGTLCIEYQRDWAGRVLCDDNGVPLPALITADKGQVSGNMKVGYLALQFVENYFGLGVHGWIGGGSTPITFFPFEILTTFDPDNPDDIYLYLYPGTVNQLLPTNIFDSVLINATKYVVLTCQSDGYSITSSVWSLENSTPTPQTATADIPPSTFIVTIGYVVYTAPVSPATKGTVKIYQLIDNILLANPLEWTRASRPDPTPFGLPYVIYYYWNITEAS